MQESEVMNVLLWRKTKRHVQKRVTMRAGGLDWKRKKEEERKDSTRANKQASAGDELSGVRSTKKKGHVK